MGYGHIEPVRGKIKRRDAVMRIRKWTRYNFGGGTFSATREEVLEKLDKDKVTKIFWRYGKTLCVGIADGIWYEGEG